MTRMPRHDVSPKSYLPMVSKHLLQFLHVSRHGRWQFAPAGSVQNTWEDDIKAATEDGDHTYEPGEPSEQGLNTLWMLVLGKPFSF